MITSYHRFIIKINSFRTITSFVILLGLPLLFTFTGCSKSEKPAETEEPQQTAVRGFRAVQWGMTADEVKKNEKLKLTGGDSSRIVFSGEVYGHKAEVYYFFDESGTLYSGTIRFEVNEKKPDEAISIYKSVKSQLEKELGKASADEVVLNDSSKTEDVKSETEGLVSGNKIFTADWNDNPGTQIGIILSKSGDSPLTLGIVYQRK